MKSRLLGMWCGAAILLGFGTARGQALEGDLARLQGRWVSTAAAGPGRRASSTGVIDVNGTTLRFTVKLQNGPSASSVSRLRIDETADPKTFDVIASKSGREELPDNLGIYELQGDTLRLCMGGPGAKRPTRFQGSALGFPSLITYERDKSAPAARGGGPAGGRTKADGADPRPEVHQGVTVAKVTPKRITLRTAEGREIEAIARGGQGLDAGGKVTGPASSVMSEGNVLDVTLVKIGGTTGNLMGVQEARLVRGELPESGLALQGETFKGAVVKGVSPNRVLLNINGKEYAAPPSNPAARAFDRGGDPLPAGSADRLLRVGNKVDVTLQTQQRKTTLFPILGIHLVEGKLLDPAR